MSRKRIKKAQWGLQFNSSPLTSINPEYSFSQSPNFNTTLQFGQRQQGFQLLNPDIQNTWDEFRQNSDKQGFNIGLQSLTSSDPYRKQWGQQLVQDGMNKLNQQLPQSTSYQLNEKGIAEPTGFNFNLGMTIGGAVFDLASTLMPEKSEYAGNKGDITQTMDTLYDGISNTAMAFGPVGMAVGTVMKGGKFLGKGINALGGGTDGMTNTDAILGSSFLSLSPLGLINGFGGSRANTFTKDTSAFETVGSSYTGSESTINDAVNKAGKKYGLFSQNAKNKANKLIDEAKRQQNIITNVADQATDRFSIAGAMSAINGNRRRYQLQGGYNQSAVRVGKQGMVIQDLQRAQRIVSSMKYQKGGKMTDPFNIYLQSLPENQRDSTNFRVKDYWEFNGRPKNFDEAVSKGMFTQFKDGWHAKSIAENPKTGEIEYMKSSNHPTRYMESDWYEKGLVYDEDENGNIISIKLSPGVDGYDDWLNFTKNYELQKTEPYWKYVKRKGTDQPQSFKEGGSLTKSDWLVEVDINNIPLEFRGEDIEEVELDSILPEFKEGGKFNLIPEGALHARKHNMDVDGITSKGIPVVSRSDGGEIEQQAEIEKEEIIFRLEVTKKLEELAKDGSDEAAIEAGKLLVEEILYNTIDNTHSLI